MRPEYRILDQKFEYVIFFTCESYVGSREIYTFIIVLYQDAFEHSTANGIKRYEEYNFIMSLYFSVHRLEKSDVRSFQLTPSRKKTLRKSK